MYANTILPLLSFTKAHATFHWVESQTAIQLRLSHTAVPGPVSGI